MPKGFSSTLILIIIALLLVLPIALWVSFNKISSSLSKESVKGASSSTIYAKPGFSVKVVSKGGGWDLFQYLCKTIEECEISVDSGKRGGTVSGGSVDSKEIIIGFDPSWSEYKYIKYYVKPSWSNDAAVLRKFNVTDLGSYPDSISKEMGGINFVISPLTDIQSKFQKSATFSDQ
jgi:hypothetical protein